MKMQTHHGHWIVPRGMVLVLSVKSVAMSSIVSGIVSGWSMLPISFGGTNFIAKRHLGLPSLLALPYKLCNQSTYYTPSNPRVWIWHIQHAPTCDNNLYNLDNCVCVKWIYIICDNGWHMM